MLNELVAKRIKRSLWTMFQVTKCYPGKMQERETEMMRWLQDKFPQECDRVQFELWKQFNN